MFGTARRRLQNTELGGEKNCDSWYPIFITEDGTLGSSYERAQCITREEAELVCEAYKKLKEKEVTYIYK